MSDHRLHVEEMDPYHYHQSWNQMPRFRLLFVVTCISLVIYFFWIQLEYKPVYTETHVTELIQISLKEPITDLPYLDEEQQQENIQEQLRTTQEKRSKQETSQQQQITIEEQKTTQQQQEKQETSQQQQITNEEQKTTQEQQNSIQEQQNIIREQHIAIQHQQIKTQQQNKNTQGKGNEAEKQQKTAHWQNVTTDLKHILFWTVYDMAPFHYFKEGQTSFIKNNCPWTNCYATANRTLFNGDMTKFDAIGFNGRVMTLDDLPAERSPHQKYIYFNMESADNFPVCDEEFDNFFNWTSTYKLDSDIPYPYIIIRNKEGDFIGPKINMHWPQNFTKVDSDLAARLANKTKAAAWFVSHCSSRSGRDEFVKKLQKAFVRYNLTVDVYGRCGPLECPRKERSICTALLEQDYFFYMSLENSFDEDYVTEKLLTALQHDSVPIVLGGIDYSRFLPPGSYIDSKKYNVKKLAAYINLLMRNPDKYSRFFRWKSQYTYGDPTRIENVCAVCAALNEKMDTVTVYDQFRKWWHPDYENRCS